MCIGAQQGDFCSAQLMTADRSAEFGQQMHGRCTWHAAGSWWQSWWQSVVAEIGHDNMHRSLVDQAMASAVWSEVQSRMSQFKPSQHRSAPVSSVMTGTTTSMGIVSMDTIQLMGRHECAMRERRLRPRSARGPLSEKKLRKT